jgi:hypothetical protein
MLFSITGYSRLVAILFLISGLAFTPESHAQTFIQAPNQTFAIDLDTMDGAFSSWANNDLGSISGLRATIEVQRIGKHNSWLPSFSVNVSTSAGAFGLVFTAADWKPPVGVYTYSKGEKEKIGQISVGEKTNIEMDWSTSGKLIVRVGNAKARELPISAPVTGIKVSASTGELTLHSISLGQFTH